MADVFVKLQASAAAQVKQANDEKDAVRLAARDLKDACKNAVADMQSQKEKAEEEAKKAEARAAQAEAKWQGARADRKWYAKQLDDAQRELGESRRSQKHSAALQQRLKQVLNELALDFERNSATLRRAEQAAQWLQEHRGAWPELREQIRQLSVTCTTPLEPGPPRGDETEPPMVATAEDLLKEAEALN